MRRIGYTNAYYQSLFVFVHKKSEQWSSQNVEKFIYIIKYFDNAKLMADFIITILVWQLIKQNFLIS